MRRPLATLAAALVTALFLAGCSLGNDDSRPGQVGAKGSDDQAAQKLGFPFTATRNTLRIGGGDATTDAAGVANALFPATNESDRPTAVVLVDKNDWQSAVAAAVLSGPPIGAPILLSDGSSVPGATADTLDRLKPRGSDLSKDAQVIRVGDDVARPSGYKTAVVEGNDAFERSAAVDRFFSAARGRPSNNVVLYSSDDAAFAMPAAAWAARSGDAALPVKRDSVPAPILRALREHGKPTVYVLGPERVISNKVLAQVRGVAQLCEAHLGADSRGVRYRVRPIPPGELRLGGRRARLQLHGGQHLAAHGRGRRGAAGQPGRVRPAAPHRSGRRPAEAAGELPAQRAARL